MACTHTARSPLRAARSPLREACSLTCARVDIFVSKGDPDGCMVNENSLSSGSDTWPHRMYVARLWAEGHERGLYKTFGDAAGPIAYMTTEGDIPDP